jgi:predicted TIM-barrel fold metal-dependent hydrolase
MIPAEPLVSQPMRLAETLERPRFAMPAGACDTHIHVFGPLDRYPSVQHPQYTLPEATLPQYRDVMGVLGIGHFVLVQPSFYDTDNRCLIDTLRAAGDGIARGVVMIDPATPEAMLAAYHAAGVRGVRLDLFKRRELPLRELERHILDMAARIAPLGWHLQFYAPGYIVRDLLDFLAGLQADFVIDHMGYMLEEDGLTEADFQRLLALLAQGRCWLKLSAPYRLAKKRGMDAVNEIARAIVRAAPGRAIWGSDWPHIPQGGMDSGKLLNLLADWAPDAADRETILVDNPRRLFGFGE